MNPFEYYALMANLVDHFNDVFELQLTATFAFVIAAHFISAHENNRLFTLMMTIYGFSAAVFTFRFAISTQSLGKLNAFMTEAGVPPPPHAVPEGQATFILLSMFSLMILVSISAIYFAYRKKSQA